MQCMEHRELHSAVTWDRSHVTLQAMSVDPIVVAFRMVFNLLNALR